MSSKSEIRTVILYCFERGLTTTQAKKEIAALKGTKWASFSTIKRWYKKFRVGDTGLEDKKKLRKNRPASKKPSGRSSSKTKSNGKKGYVDSFLG